MNTIEWGKLRRDNAHMSDKEFAMRALNLQHNLFREELMQQEQDRIVAAAEQQIEQQIDKNLEKVLEKAFKGGNASLDIKLNL